MKKCKVITITHLNTPYRTVIDTKNARVTEDTYEEEVINTYLAQGYEIKQVCKEHNNSKIYLEKDV